jgi:hypothetical protein
VPEKEIKKPVMDVEKPGTTPASATSRPLIVGRGPAIKDPMVNDSNEETVEQSKSLPLPSAKKKTIQPITEPQEEAEVQSETKPEPASEQPAEPGVATDLASTEEEEKAATAEAEAELSEEERKRQELTDKLISEKKYFVPIGAAEKRRTLRNTTVLFIVFIVVIAATVLAIDAELVQTNITLPFDLIK